uniref:EF-hand domain-containing protein n=1 Tax=Acrobeloides nanus TaxID=290746 RepID=A0A914DBK0_9BILA
MGTIKRRAAVALDASNHAPLIKSGSDPDNTYTLARLQLKKPLSLKQAMKDTHFSSAEIKTLYRAFKDTSPTALIDRDTEFVKTLSILCKGGLEEKFEWIYKLYDPTNSGFIHWERLFYIITAIDDLIGMKAKPRYTREQRVQRADEIFQKFDPHGTGMITKQQFLDICRSDKSICDSIFSLHTILPK